MPRAVWVSVLIVIVIVAAGIAVFYRHSKIEHFVADLTDVEKITRPMPCDKNAPSSSLASQLFKWNPVRAQDSIMPTDGKIACYKIIDENANCPPSEANVTKSSIKEKTYFPGLDGPNVHSKKCFYDVKKYVAPVAPQVSQDAAAQQNCTQPAGWCIHSSATATLVDCTGGSVKGDLICTDSIGQKGTVLRSGKCVPTWPNATKESCPNGFVDEYYNLQNKLLSNKCLDGDGKTFVPCDSTKASQLWTPVVGSTGTLYKNKESGNCLDGNGTNTYPLSCQTGNPYQNWNVAPSDTFVQMKHGQSGECLAATAAGSTGFSQCVPNDDAQLFKSVKVTTTTANVFYVPPPTLTPAPAPTPAPTLTPTPTPAPAPTLKTIKYTAPNPLNLKGTASATLDLASSFAYDGTLSYSLTNPGLNTNCKLEGSTLTVNSLNRESTYQVTFAATPSAGGPSVNGSVQVVENEIPVKSDKYSQMPTMNLNGGEVKTLDLAQYFTSTLTLTFALSDRNLNNNCEFSGSTLKVTAGDRSLSYVVSFTATNPGGSSVNGQVSVEEKEIPPTLLASPPKMELNGTASGTLDLAPLFSKRNLKYELGNPGNNTNCSIAGSVLTVRAGPDRDMEYDVPFKATTPGGSSATGQVRVVETPAGITIVGDGDKTCLLKANGSGVDNFKDYGPNDWCGIGNDGIRSIKVPNGYKVRIFQNWFTGYYWDLTESKNLAEIPNPWLNYWQNNVSTLTVWAP